MMAYESGLADRWAKARTGRHPEPWLNVLEACEPGVPPALDYAIATPAISRYIRGRALDMGAGTCWATAKLSTLSAIDEVVALDMSERFLTDVGPRIIEHFGGVPAKIGFAVGSFNHVPLPDASFDCAWLISAIHHSLSPVKTLLEARRLLRPDGTLFVLEGPSSVLQIRQRRLHSIAMSHLTNSTEMNYTKGELEYLIRHAGFEPTAYPVATNTRGIVRKALRAGLRATGLEGYVRPAMYVIVCRKCDPPVVASAKWVDAGD